MKSLTLKGTAILALAAIATFSAAQIAVAAGKQASPSTIQKIKSKQCVMLFSPRYKKLRIKPIQISFRWCSKANPADCTKWESDTIADTGKPFTIAAYCFTHHTPVMMDLRYNKRFGESQNRANVKIQPHAMKLQGNLAPHPFCAGNAAHRFVMKRGGASMKAGRPRAAIMPKCVWLPVKKGTKPAA